MVDDAAVVRGLERLSDLAGNLERFRHGHGPADQPRGEIVSFDQLERQEESVVRFLETVDGGNVRRLSEASRCASRLNRARRSASRATFAGSTLMATSRPSVVSVAR